MSTEILRTRVNLHLTITSIINIAEKIDILN